MERVLKQTAQLWRKVAGDSTRLERLVKRRYRDAIRAERGDRAVLYSNQHAVLVRSKGQDEPRRGVFLRGGCDLPSLFLAGPLITDSIRSGSLAIARPPDAVGSSQSAQLLQSLEGIDPALVQETCERLRIRPSFFRPSLFDETFEMPGMERFGSFPKSVVVLSIGSDLTRSLHRHRRHGFLVDIGGWWLNQSLDKAIQDMDTVRWFRENFELVGRIEVEDFVTNVVRLVGLVREKLGAELIMYNTLAVEPGSPHHNYQLLARDHFTRRREFNIALADLSRQLGFHIVDVDRILKQHGVREQVDFAHFPVEGKMPVAREAFRILKDLEIV